MNWARHALSRPFLFLPALIIAACQHPDSAGAPADPAVTMGGADSRRELPVAWAPGIIASQSQYIRAGNRLLASQEPDLAMKMFMRSISTDGVSAEALGGAGIAAAQQGMLTSARRHLEDARDLDPDSVTTNNNLGVVLFMLKEYHQARDAFRMAFAVSSGRSEFAEDNLNRTEAVLALIDSPGEDDGAVTYRVERRGSSVFRLVGTDEAEAQAQAEQAEEETEE